MATQYLRPRQSSDRYDKIIPNVDKDIVLITNDPNNMALMALFSRIKTRVSVQEKFTWQIDELTATSDTLSAAVTGTTNTNLPVTNPTRWLPNELYICKRTREVVLTDTVNTATSVVVVQRQISATNSNGGTAAAALVSGDVFVRLLPLNGELSTRQTTRTTVPSDLYNYCQYTRADLTISERQIKREFLNGDELPYQQKKLFKEFGHSWNRALYHNQRGSYTLADGAANSFGGIHSWITTNVLSVSGTLYEWALDDFLATYMIYGSNKIVTLCSSRAMVAFCQVLKSQLVPYTLEFNGLNKTIGFTVQRYISPTGIELLLVHDRSLSDNWNGTAYGIDMNNVEMMEFSNNGFTGNMQIRYKTQDNDSTTQSDTLVADMGPKWGDERFHFRMSGITEGSAGRASI